MNNRAFSILEVKSVDEDKRIIRGIATTPSVDRVGDIIDPLGVKFANPLPLLWQHEHDKPIGSVKFDKPTKAGINFEAEIAMTDEPGTLKDRLDEAWQSIKMGLVKAVSIGFRAIEYAFMESGGVRFVETEVYELSAVTIPANADALITSVKSIDARLRAEHGIPDPEIPVQPTVDAATGKKTVVVKLDAPARDRAPFVINKIHPVKPAGS
jgi:HK97 family phage prohead protease